MLEACKNGETKIVQLLLERFNSEESGVNIKDNNGFNALMVACKKGNKDVVQLLLDDSERNIDLNARNLMGWTALRLACERGRKYAVKSLIEHSKTKGIDISTGQEELSDEMLLR